jgi:hypothetical protein
MTQSRRSRGPGNMQVWRIQLDITVLDAEGNVTDAAFLCALTALMAFKRPEVTVEAGEDGLQSRVVVHPVEEREAIPLSLHQAPMAITFALFQVGHHSFSPRLSLLLEVADLCNWRWQICATGGGTSIEHPPLSFPGIFKGGVSSTHRFVWPALVTAPGQESGHCCCRTGMPWWWIPTARRKLVAVRESRLS